MKASRQSAAHTEPKVEHRKQHRDLDSLLDEEEERAKSGLVHSARELIDDASSALDRRVREHPLATALVGAAVGWLLLGRRSRGLRGQARRGVVLPMLARFASSTAMGALLGRAARTKGSRYFPF